MKRIVLIILCLALSCVLLAGCQEAAGKGGPTDHRTVSLDQTELTVVVGENPTKLNVLLSSGRGAFQWESSDEQVVTVDQNGNVTGLSVGSATVTVTCAELEPAACQVTVVLPGHMPVFTADPTGQGIAKSIAVGGTIQLDGSLKFSGIPVDAQVTYLSKDAAIAAVSDTGVVTGVKAGTTQIQAVAVYMDMEVHMTVDVTVLPA